MKRSPDVEEFMEKLEHPFKSEVQVIRRMIKSLNKEIEEEIKWNAPSFSYQGEYLVTFNLWEKNRIHLVFHNPEIANVKSPLLEGKYDHRRMTYFTGMNDINSKRFAFEKVLKDLIKLQKKKRRAMNKSAASDNTTPSQHIDRRIEELGDWRGKLLARLRKIILKAAPELAEEWKWDTPVWSHNGNVVAAGVFQDHLKLNFFKGAQLEDHEQLFNAGLDAKATRAIDLYERDKIDEAALRDLVRAAVALNGSKAKPTKSARR